MLGTCKLCGQTAELIKSHIIPRSFFHAIKGQSKQLLAAVSRDKKPVEYYQNGIWDDNILCDRCESLFCGWDTYGFNVLGDPPGNNSPILSDSDVVPFILKNINYKDLKLFALSVLWRASVTKHGFFERINLGPHEAKIADMIRTGDPKSPDDYSVIICRLIRQKYQTVIFPPWRVKIANINFNILYLPCIKIHIKVDQQPLCGAFRIGMLQDREENIALPMDSQRSEHLLLDEARKIFKTWQPSRPPK